jgi:hypothetical protein
METHVPQSIFFLSTSQDHIPVFPYFNLQAINQSPLSGHLLSSPFITLSFFNILISLAYLPILLNQQIIVNRLQVQGSPLKNG